MAIEIEPTAIDQLVDGSLSDEQRRELLVLLDSEPEGWRRCALAFLEAQVFRQAIGPALHAMNASAQPVFASVGPNRVSPRLYWLAPLMGKAAAIALIFAVGWGIGASRTSSASRKPVPPGPHTFAPARLEIASAESPAVPESALTSVYRPEPNDLRAPLAILDRERLERSGYRIDERPGFLVQENLSGGTSYIPASQIQIRYVGAPVY